MSPEYLVALAIDPMPEGAEYPAGVSLPLYCTMMHWFEGRKPMLDKILYPSLMLAACEPDEVELVSESATLFGPKNDVPCHLVKRTEELVLLHNRIFELLAKNDCLPEELRWVGAGWNPHVADRGERSFPPGTKCFVDHLVLVRRGPNRAKVVVQSHEIGGIPF